MRGASFLNRPAKHTGGKTRLKGDLSSHSNSGGRGGNSHRLGARASRLRGVGGGRLGGRVGGSGLGRGGRSSGLGGRVGVTTATTVTLPGEEETPDETESGLTLGLGLGLRGHEASGSNSEDNLGKLHFVGPMAWGRHSTIYNLMDCSPCPKNNLVYLSVAAFSFYLMTNTAIAHSDWEKPSTTGRRWMWAPVEQGDGVSEADGVPGHSPHPAARRITYLIKR